MMVSTHIITYLQKDRAVAVSFFLELSWHSPFSASLSNALTNRSSRLGQVFEHSLANKRFQVDSNKKTPKSDFNEHGLEMSVLV